KMSSKKNKSSNSINNQTVSINRITFLGTASMAPMPLKRNVSFMVLTSTNGYHHMIDCGEGTQHQIKLSLLKTSKIHSIYITHLHGDHSYGIFGLLHSIKITNRNYPLNIYGPIGIKSYIINGLSNSGGWYCDWELNI